VKVLMLIQRRRLQMPLSEELRPPAGVAVTGPDFYLDIYTHKHIYVGSVFILLVEFNMLAHCSFYWKRK
jgi:hypothetical protein